VAARRRLSHRPHAIFRWGIIRIAKRQARRHAAGRCKVSQWLRKSAKGWRHSPSTAPDTIAGGIGKSLITNAYR
jgi:hypothetical protein